MAVLGATGAVGQEFVQTLEGHPWFEVTQIAASERSAGKKYLDAIRGAGGTIGWEVGGEVPEYAREMVVRSIEQVEAGELDLVFSAIESGAARDVEARFAAQVPVISTSSAHRYDEDVPILIPGVNDGHADLLDAQRANRGWKGWVAPLPNCTTTGLAITLKPLHERYGVRKVLMTSMQAISGAGRSPGVPATSITDNIIPYIANEEKKVRVETRKILGRLEGGRIREADVRVSATCTRVPVIDGHTESVSVETEGEADPREAGRLFDEANASASVAGLPSAPEKYYAFHTDPTRPQPRLEREVGGGMTTTVGRMEREELFANGLKYVLFSHNKKMGSGKGAVLLAEMLLRKGKI